MTEASSNALQRPQGPRREPAPAIPLSAYLKAKVPAPRQYLNSALRLPPPPPTEEEKRATLELLKANGDALHRLEALIAELRDASSTLSQQAIRLAEAFVGVTSPSDSGPVVASGVEGVWQEIRRVRTSLQETQNRRVLETAVRFVLWTSRLRQRLDDDDFAELALRAFPPATKKKARETASPGLGQILAPVLHKQVVREPLLAVHEHDRKRLQRAQECVQEGNQLATKLRGEIEQLQSALQQAQDRTAQLTQDVAARDEQIHRMSQDISDHRAVKRHTEKQIRSRVSGLLNDDLLPLVRDIHDSASIEPVRTHIILDRADSALNLIQKETAWLASSD